MEALLTCLVSLRATAPDAQVLVVEDRARRPASLARRGRRRRARLRLRRTRTTAPASSPRPTSASRSRAATGLDAVLVGPDVELPHAGWLERLQARTRHPGPPRRRRRRPPRCTPTACVAARRLLLLRCSGAAGSTASAACPGRGPRGPAAALCPVERPAAADPLRDAARRSASPTQTFGRRYADDRLLPARVRGRASSASTSPRAVGPHHAACRCALAGARPPRSASPAPASTSRHAPAPSTASSRTSYERPPPHPVRRPRQLAASPGTAASLPATALGADWVGVAGKPPELRFVTGVTRRRAARSTRLRSTTTSSCSSSRVGEEWVARDPRPAGARRDGAVRDRRLPRRPCARSTTHELRASSTASGCASAELNMRDRRRRHLLDAVPRPPLPQVQRAACGSAPTGSTSSATPTRGRRARARDDRLGRRRRPHRLRAAVAAGRRRRAARAPRRPLQHRRLRVRRRAASRSSAPSAAAASRSRRSRSTRRR